MFKSSRKRLATLVAAAIASCALSAAVMPVADASASTIAGTVLSGNTTNRMAGVAVWAARSNGGAWSSEFKLATSSSTGTYSATVTGGYWYYVHGVTVIGRCFGPLYRFDGYSNSFYVYPNSTASATIRMWNTFTTNC